jgi:hypothetical protein
VNVLLVRGVGLTAGLGVLFGKGAKREEIGEKPDSSDPYRLAVSWPVFVGLTYNFD